MTKETNETMADTNRTMPKVRVGKVVSNKMDKTIVIAFERMHKHKVYKKFIRKTNKVYAHDKNNECQIGDIVKVIETRPLSKTKRWKLSEIVERAK